MCEEELDDFEVMLEQRGEIITKARAKVSEELEVLSEVERNKVIDRVDMLSRRIHIAESILLVWLRDWIRSSKKPISIRAFGIKLEKGNGKQD